ncbi:hypothetical protein FOBRF1_007208 [Fusarium oxysporum]
MSAGSHKNFRLCGIPLEYETRTAVRGLIQQTLSLQPSTSLTVYSLATSPVDQNSKIATLSFSTIPERLSDRSRDEWVIHLSDGNDIAFSKSLVFDTHFSGFTPFQHTSDRDCRVDVIAVCGLGGHALGSFKEKNGPFVWLRDALPLDAPNARILTYGYDTKLVKSGSFQNLTDLARALQLDLEDIRDPSLPRSIVFIGHSLGGLVIKETVLRLKEEPLGSDCPTLSAISGFAFFGVPHRGLAVECLVPLVKDRPNRALLESLNKNSALLERLQKEFEKLLRVRRRCVVSFYETERSPTAVQVEDGKWELSGPSEVLVEVFSATCGSQQQHPINRNHSEMVKYSSAHDQLYRRVTIALRPVLSISRVRLNTGAVGSEAKVSFLLSDDEKECLRSLSFPEQEHRYSEISYTKDTCDWLVEQSEYQSWMNNHRGLFWIKGSPGTGKSVLMKFALEAMNRRKSGELIVSFFVHGRGVPLQRTPIGMFRALLNSLLMSFPTFLGELTARFQDQQQRFGSYEQQGGWRWNEKELQRFLSRLLIEGTASQPVVIFLDALDECGEEHAKHLLTYFKDLMDESQREEALVRICFSSRHYPIISLETMPRIYVEEKNDKDIRLVIEERLKEIQPDRKRRQIENEILLKAHGGFQWAILITNMIRDEDARGARTKHLLSMISTVPPDLNELYDVVLSGIDKDKEGQMVKLFQWVLYAKRPLSAQELREALATDKDMTCTTISELRSKGNWSDSVAQFETRVRYISRGLVEFQTRDIWEQYEPGGEEWNREAQFIHQSAADFIAQRFLTRSNGDPKSRSPTGAGHFQISRSFLRYLTLEEVLNGGALSRGKLSATFPLMPYGVAHILYHIRAVEEAEILQPDLIDLVQWKRPERLNMLAKIWRIMDSESTHAPRGWPFVGASVLHLVVAFNSSTLLSSLLHQNRSNLYAQDSAGNTPLHLALQEDRQDLALLILNRSKTWQTEEEVETLAEEEDGISVSKKFFLGYVNVVNLDGESPLSLAVSIKADKAIRTLIDAGAEVQREKSLLFYAISSQDKVLLSQLIKAGTDLEGAIFFATQCLTQASHLDGILHDLVRYLLEVGANAKRILGFEALDIEGVDRVEADEVDEEAMTLASRHGKSEIVRLLLSHRSSPKLRDKNGKYPLEIAAENGHLETAKVLFQAFPQIIHYRYCPGQSVLNSIIKQDLVELVLFIAEEGCGIFKLQQIFYEAVQSNSLRTVEALLEKHGSAIDRADERDEGFKKPYLVFTDPFITYRKMVQILVSAKKLPSSWIRDYSLSWALKNGTTEAIRLFLEREDIDVNQKDDEGQTPLEYAQEIRNVELAERLLSTGRVHIHQRGKDGQTPFSRALRDDHAEMVVLLLDSKEFNIHEEDNGLGYEAFLWAVQRKNVYVMNSLHDSYVYNINTKDTLGRTPLIKATIEGDTEAVMVLLDTGRADIFAVDDLGYTALEEALRSGHILIANLLFSHQTEYPTLLW